jgi:hypothetical protein
MTDPHADFAQGVAYAIRKHTTKRHTGNAPTLTNSYKQPRLTVILSVRHPDGGLPFRFEHSSDAISPLDAELRARATARAQGLRDWALIDITCTP